MAREKLERVLVEKPRFKAIDFIPILGMFTVEFKNYKLQKKGESKELNVQQRKFCRAEPFFALYHTPFWIMAGFYAIHKFGWDKYIDRIADFIR